MNSQPLISISVPAYRRIAGLKILLDSVAGQTFTDYEVIITDDSPDDTVKDFCVTYQHTFKLVYYKNVPALGTPENWNEGIRRATGTWVKLMHDDDYFASADSLALFASAITDNPQAQLLYGAFVFEDVANKTKKIIACNWFDRFILSLSPYHMLRRNYFGNPSCILVKRDVPFLYDNRFKYIVDFAYYIELLQNKIGYQYIDKVLIHVGINDDQVTNYTYKNKAVQMYENHVLFEKIGVRALHNIIAFDYYWRIYRNFEIKSAKNIEPFYKGQVADVLQRIIAFQQRVSPALLKKGLFSKAAMLVCYCQLRLKGVF